MFRRVVFNTWLKERINDSSWSASLTLGSSFILSINESWLAWSSLHKFQRIWWAVGWIWKNETATMTWLHSRNGINGAVRIYLKYQCVFLTKLLFVNSFYLGHWWCWNISVRHLNHIPTPYVCCNTCQMQMGYFIGKPNSNSFTKTKLMKWRNKDMYPYKDGCFHPWTFSFNIGLNM